MTYCICFLRVLGVAQALWVSFGPSLIEVAIGGKMLVNDKDSGYIPCCSQTALTCSSSYVGVLSKIFFEQSVPQKRSLKLADLVQLSHFADEENTSQMS